jgi:hypothetical protein
MLFSCSQQFSCSHMRISTIFKCLFRLNLLLTWSFAFFCFSTLYLLLFLRCRWPLYSLVYNHVGLEVIATLVMKSYISWEGRLCGLVVTVPGYRSRDPGFDSRLYQIFWEVVGLERGPLSLVRIIEELLERKSSGFGQENRINGRGDPLRWSRDNLY